MMFETMQRTQPAGYPPRPEFRLAGRRVTQEMYYQAHEAKRNGRRVFMVTAGDSEMSGTAGCANCCGYGRMGLETVIAGPFQDVPSNGDRGEGHNTVHVSAVCKDRLWYQVTRDYYECPLCGTKKSLEI